jgi:hypothetical protein
MENTRKALTAMLHPQLQALLAAVKARLPEDFVANDSDITCRAWVDHYDYHGYTDGWILRAEISCPTTGQMWRACDYLCQAGVQVLARLGLQTSCEGYFCLSIGNLTTRANAMALQDAMARDEQSAKDAQEAKVRADRDNLIVRLLELHAAGKLQYRDDAGKFHAFVA